MLLVLFLVLHVLFNGQADKMPITEAAPIKPAESPYGNTKTNGGGNYCRYLQSDSQS